MQISAEGNFKYFLFADLNQSMYYMQSRPTTRRHLFDSRRYQFLLFGEAGPRAKKHLHVTHDNRERRMEFYEIC